MLFQKVGTPPGPGTETIDVVSLADRSRRTLVRGVGSARYLESGHLVYTDKAKMFAMPFDLERLETRGTAVEVLDDVAYDSVANLAQYDVSRTGTLVYRRSSGSPMSTLEWVDSTGKHESLRAKPGAYVGTPRISPDGKRIALALRDGANQDIWVYEPQRDSMTRLTFGGRMFALPVWSQDGQHVLFSALGSGLYSSRADGAGQPQALEQDLIGSIRLPTSVTRDGTRLVYFQPDGNPQLWTVPIERGGGGLKVGTPERFLTTKFSDQDAAFSPDGRWIAYASNESGKFEVYVRAFAAGAPAAGERWPISNSGGGFPAWLPNGRELLYQSGDQIMRVGYRVSGNSFVAETPRVWATNVRSDGGFDLAPDGGRIVASVPVVAPGAQTREHSVVFVLNFFDELRRRLPVDR